MAAPVTRPALASTERRLICCPVMQSPSASSAIVIAATRASKQSRRMLQFSSRYFGIDFPGSVLVLTLFLFCDTFPSTWDFAGPEIRGGCHEGNHPGARLRRSCRFDPCPERSWDHHWNRAGSVRIGRSEFLGH